MTYRWYEAVRRLGVDVDIVRPGASLKGYRLVLPTLPHVSDAAHAAFRDEGLRPVRPANGIAHAQLRDSGKPRSRPNR